MLFVTYDEFRTGTAQPLPTPICGHQFRDLTLLEVALTHPSSTDRIAHPGRVRPTSTVGLAPPRGQCQDSRNCLTAQRFLVILAKWLTSDRPAKALR